MVALGLGFYAAIAALRAVAGRIDSNRSVALRAVTPWIILAALLLGVSVLLMSLPMDMRGVSLGS